MAGVPDAGSPADLLMVLSDHLGGGRSSPVAQQRLMEVLGTLPTSCRGEGGRLWRGISVPAHLADALASGARVELDARPLSFWSRHRHPAMSLLRERAASGSAEDRFLLLARVVPTEDLALDVELTLRHFGADHADFPGWAYAAREGEVMVHGQGRPFRILPDDVAAVFTRNDPGLWTPAPGETILLEDGRDAVVNDHPGPDGMIGTNLGRVHFKHSGLGWNGEPADPADDPGAGPGI